MNATPITITERCKVCCTTPGVIGFSETVEWMTPAQAESCAASFHRFGKKEIQIVTHKKINGRWRYAGRVPFNGGNQ